MIRRQSLKLLFAAMVAFILGAIVESQIAAFRDGLQSKYQYGLMYSLDLTMQDFFTSIHRTPESLQELLTYYAQKHGDIETAFPGASKRLAYVRLSANSCVIAGFRVGASPVLQIHDFDSGLSTRIVATDRWVSIDNENSTGQRAG